MTPVATQRDFVVFEEGRKALTKGLPSTCYFLLSTRPCFGSDTHLEGDTLAGGVGEITGTSYSRQTAPAPEAEWLAYNETWVFNFEETTWATTLSHGWDGPVRSVVMASTRDDSGSALAAFGCSEPVDLSEAWQTYMFRATLTVKVPR